MPTKRCYFHPDCRSTLFSLPRDGEVRDQWLKFIFNSVPQNYYPNLALCAAHFTEESFHNLREFNAGFAQRLVLKDGAVPTLKTEAVYGPQPTTSQQGSSSQELPTTSTLHEVGCQSDPIETETVATEIKPKMRSVGTQLSMGHSAKFGSYTIMHMETNKILDLQLVQNNEVGGSYHMEKEGLKRCLDKLESNGLAVDYIVTDRHPQIQKYLRDRNITQFYDVWHFEKGLSKKLDKLSKMKDCEVLKKWLHSIKNHVYWSAISSESGPEKVAKWNSLQNHIQNVHVHENHLFPKCEHPDKVSRDPKKWIQPGSIALHKVEKLLYNKRVLKDIEKLSHNFQTSSLEAFHSLILRFAPKNVIFPFIGMLCR
ncbi:uncharacterized protein LOC132114511 isoform X1 [Carassius carassius]|uniref:uncharacterized protein LOC132114511 isoform X1 n=1 Tax=Carassius carassius TaxID=217509 RepID=UPI0028691096|nr:uncharacterized protein LOC132114511 isoform X1 [Carassius carassius]